MISMSRFLCGLMVSCAVVFYACGSDGGSAPSDNNNVGANFVGEKDYIVLDEMNKKMTIYTTSRDSHCEVENDSYKFVEDVETRQVTRDYLFIGDTLVLLYDDEGEIYGLVFVGGKNGQIKDTWKRTTCDYTHESNSITCGSDNVDVVGGFKYYFTFTQDTLYISGTDLQGNVIDINAPQEDEYDDYAGSEFVQELFSIMENTNKGIIVSGNTPAPWEAFREPWSSEGGCDIECVALKKNVTIVNRDKNHISFVYDGTSYELDFTNALHLWYSRGTRTELSATLKSDKGECSLTYMGDVIGSAPEICSAENAQYMNMGTYFDNNA